jgi:hypothetical protein
MSRCRFKMDISFLCLLVDSLRNQGNRFIDGSPESQTTFNAALDSIFADIVRRNFREFESSPEYFVFQQNERYDYYSEQERGR